MAATFSTGEGDVLAAVITAGKSFLLMAKLHNGSAAQMELKQFRLDVPAGWKSELFMDKVPKALAPGDGCALTFRVTPPIDAQLTKAYFHRDDPETDADLQDRQSAVRDAGVAAAPVSADVVYSIAGQEGEIRSVARTPMHDAKGERGRCRWRSCRRFR